MMGAFKTSIYTKKFLKAELCDNNGVFDKISF